MSDEHQLQEVYRFICQYIQEHTHPPSLREIARRCYMSHSNIIRYLDRLEERGWIVREPNKSRGITLLKPCEEFTEPEVDK